MTSPATTIPVDSAWIASVTYAADATLTVHFRHGTVYRYFTVPRAIVEAFVTAPSKGAYFARHIRNAFPYTQIVEPSP
ncbi:MAG TPA: KTSC domain-containing protein [Vicinamibacterales bacterium]